MVSDEPLPVRAELCEPGSKHCETARAAKLYLASVSSTGKRATGRLTADFPQAGHKEGKFTVKYQHKSPAVICE
jgi:hypothetical protein